MAYRNTYKLIYPLGNFKNTNLNFNEISFYDDKYWGVHLGVDMIAKAGTKVFAIGRGVVVYSKLHLGELNANGSIKQRNWGGIVIIAHKNPNDKKVFYSLCGHLGKRYVKIGDGVEAGDLIGTIGESMTESNGLWESEHLHFSIYHGPFNKKVLPGYYKKESDNTMLEYWEDPIKFIKKYNGKKKL